ncbi:EH signature domain-containing protein [Methylotetracoccus oryzae]|uniref:EH signature domain-containing protein n=1 Tax=Methylotetracoccus oryzae TaxID=1919059 RepID=UPI0011195157|nr:EH signature domain-containing protein [Methylotetracoccus oryzae]
MRALDRLSVLLQNSARIEERPFSATDELETVIAALQRHNKAGASINVPRDLQQAAVRKFWDALQFESFKDAQSVSFGLCVPSRPSGPCVMEDRQRFVAVLDAKTGVDQWINEPRWYRRCYQGLVRSYFAYDVDHAPAVGKQNWAELRDYLYERTPNIVDSKSNPEWVTTAVDNRQLFGKDPCAPYASDVLTGDSTKIDRVCEQLGVVKSSWLLRELVLSPVRQATEFDHERFKGLIPRLLELLANNQVLRDRGLILVLDKYASASHPGINEPLRNASVEWWGNPWLPSNEMRWGGVVPAAREMVSEWLKREFIEAFFTKLAEDGVGDRRRANFWLRYVKSVSNIQFALGARALNSRDRDYEVLRTKMKGLLTELKTNDSSNNAFIMTLGDLVAVEFGGMGNALYGYDARKSLPFDLSREVVTTVNAPNSLKHSQRMLWMQHQDGIKGWSKWEDMFEATLKESFDIRPDAAAKRVTARIAAPGAVPSADSLPVSGPDPHELEPPLAPTDQNSPPRGVGPGAKHQHGNEAFSAIALHSFARAHKLRIEDMSQRNGNLWVRTGTDDLNVNMVLRDWGFRYKPGKGWWR